MPDSSASPLRRRALIVLTVVGTLGFGGGALANVAIARLLALPADAEIPQYTDATPPDGPHPPVGTDGPGGDGPSADAPSHLPPRPRVLSEKQYADVIVKRNIFDSSAVYDPATAAKTDVAGECKSDASVKLLATIVADLPTYSSALIATGSARDAKADGYSVGDEVGSEGRITIIEQNKVCLDGGACICIGADAAKVASAKPDGATGGEGVDQISENKFSVDQSVIDDAMNNFETLASQLRVVPHKGADGAIDGYRVSAIRRGSLFDKLGIKNGDIVHGVNGQGLTSTEGALATYQTLKSEKAFSFDITRRNQRQTLEYEVK